MAEEIMPVPADIDICDMQMEGRPDSDYIDKYVLPQPSAYDLAHCARHEQRSDVEESREAEDEDGDEEYDDDKASTKSVDTVANKPGSDSDEILLEWAFPQEDREMPGGGYWWCFMDQLLDIRQRLGIDVTRAFLTMKEDLFLLELVALPIDVEERLLRMMGLRKATEGDGEERGGEKKDGDLECGKYGRLIRVRDIFAI